jgi:hypothetical protein
VVTNARVYYTTRAAAGASDTRLSLRPLFGEGGRFQQTSGVSRRENAEVCFPSLPATNAKRLRKGAKRRSNPFFLYIATWIASRSLSSGAHSRDPLARNDASFSPPSARVSAWQGRDERSSLLGVGGGGLSVNSLTAAFAAQPPPLIPPRRFVGEGKQGCAQVAVREG